MRNAKTVLEIIHELLCKITGELCDIERVRHGSEERRWKSTYGNSLASYSYWHDVVRRERHVLAIEVRRSLPYFNTQKNHSYHMSHQYSRSSFDAFKNYYQCMQIAHIINQLYEKGSLLKPLLIAKMSLVKLWDIMLGEMRGGELDFNFFNDLLKLRIQISFR